MANTKQTRGIFVASHTAKQMKIIYLCGMKRSSELSYELKTYIEQSILPMYDHFDRAHQRDHATTVIEESLKIAEHYEVDINMVYAIAAFHDTGLTVDRATHHLVSGKIIREDAFLKHMFSEDEVETMAQAAEDHRASSKHEPRSIYGRIVAEADRNIDAHTIVARTIQYGLSNYPELSKDGHYKRFLEHMKEKYADGGYLKLWIPESANANRLKAFRQLLQDEQQTKMIFEEEWLKQTER